MVRADLNDPGNWLRWLRVCEKAGDTPLQLDGVRLAALTGQDRRALGAIAFCWHLYASSDDNGRAGALRAVAALLPALQTKCWVFARELVAQQLDWHDRVPLFERARDLRYDVATVVASSEAIEASNRRALDSLGAFTGALRTAFPALRAETERARAVREDLEMDLCRDGCLFLRGHGGRCSNDTSNGALSYFCPACEMRYPLLHPCSHIQITPGALETLRQRMQEGGIFNV